MNYDISRILANWDYDPNNVNARYVDGEDGIQKIQLRLDLGLFQMEPTGRPDGSRPHGYDSLLDYYSTLEKTSKSRFSLDADQCAELQQEAVQYYYRYLARFDLEDYDGVIADTRHNLTLFDFITSHTEDEDLSWDFLQFKPYVYMMNTRAIAEKAVRQDNYAEAIAEVEDGLKKIKTFWGEQGETELQAESYEIDVLKELLENLKARKTASPTIELEEELELAIRKEEFERAAKIRDQLLSMQGQQS